MLAVTEAEVESIGEVTTRYFQVDSLSMAMPLLIVGFALCLAGLVAVAFDRVSSKALIMGIIATILGSFTIVASPFLTFSERNSRVQEFEESNPPFDELLEAEVGRAGFSLPEDLEQRLNSNSNIVLQNSSGQLISCNTVGGDESTEETPEGDEITSQTYTIFCPVE